MKTHIKFTLGRKFLPEQMLAGFFNMCPTLVVENYPISRENRNLFCKFQINSI